MTQDKYKGQKILVIPNPTFLDKTTNWFGPELTPYFSAAILPKVMLRKDAEENLAFRQIIPYALVRSEKSGKYLAYVRAGKEERLHGKISLGIGGHMDAEDIGPTNRPTTIMQIVSVALAREVLEEVPQITTVEQRETKIAGFIVSNASEVDKVHLGVVVELNVSDEFEANSEEVKGVWLTIEELRQKQSEGLLESWADIVVRNVAN